MRRTGKSCRAMRALTILSTLLLLGSAPMPAPRFAVIELFTSQGCSSCPPADALLTWLSGEPGVIPLSFHVDYWNYIGWTDPFSSADWSARQRSYARVSRAAQVYTPQAVVNGETQFVGSNERTARAEIRKALDRPADVRVGLERKGDSILVEASPLRRPTPGPLVVLLAEFEVKTETAVRRGENGGRKLRNDFVVRRLEKIGVLDGSTAFRQTVAVAPAAGRGIAVLAQDPRTMRIHGASALRF
jgi:hypothetical protein